MPLLNQKIEEDFRVRMMIYGYAKTGKTTWALRAAEAGYNVILCDLDDGYQVGQRLSPEAQKRVYHVDMRRPFGDITNCGALALCQAMGGRGTVFDETQRRYQTIFGPFDENSEHCVFNFGGTDLNTVLIIDSWTAFVEQLYHAKFYGDNPTEMKKKEWENFYEAQDVANIFLANLRAIGFHVIVIAHAEEYAKRKADADAKDKPSDAIEGVYVQPVSTSRPHGRTLAGKFSDVLFFNRPHGRTRMSSRGNDHMDGGSRLLEPKEYDPEDFSCAQYLELATGTKVVPTDAGFTSQIVMPISLEQLEEQKQRAEANKKPTLGGGGASNIKAVTGKVSTTSAFGGGKK